MSLFLAKLVYRIQLLLGSLIKFLESAGGSQEGQMAA